MSTIDMSKLGLRQREMQVLHYAVWARSQVPNGHYLCSPSQKRSAERLIDRGFLTKAKHGFWPPAPDWLVIVITERNLKALKKAEAT